MSSYTSHFGPNNIPYGIASSVKRPLLQCASRIGDSVIFLGELADSNLLGNIDVPLSHILRESTLNAFAALPKHIHFAVRKAIQAAHHEERLTESSENINKVTLHLPVHIGDFTDFSASKNHVLNAGEAVTGVRTFPPGFKKYPVGYAGRCSSIVVSGTQVYRPHGQYIEDYTVPEKRIIFGPSRALDYELEVGAIIGRPVPPGTHLKAKDADEHIFGLVLVNDWSSRDIQGLEMNPLGPFNGKNFATTISPWVITLDALEPFKVPAPSRMEPVAEFMDDPNSTNYDISLEVELERGDKLEKMCSVGFDTMYWTFRHMIAHHTIGGCRLRTGDLIASGTVSGESIDEHGCLLELTKNGKEIWTSSNDIQVRYLEDGDTVRFTGMLKDASSGVGFGECVGIVQPAKAFE
jgi:fumarylacetoacetase